MSGRNLGSANLALTLPRSRWRMFLVLLAIVTALASLGFRPPLALAGGGATGAHVTVEPACTGKAELDLVAYNDVAGSPPATFVLRDNLAGTVIDAGFTDIPAGEFRTWGIQMQPNDPFDITATGPNGYRQDYVGTFSCRRTSVTPKPPTFQDQPGTANDKYTVPKVTGVDYQVGAKTVAAGTYPGVGKVTVEAFPQKGYALKGTSRWSYTFTDVPPPTQPPLPQSGGGAQPPAAKPPAQQPPAAAPHHHHAKTAQAKVPAKSQGLNPGFGAKTGWGEDSGAVSGQRSNVLVPGLGLLAAFGLLAAAFLRRRKVVGEGE